MSEAQQDPEVIQGRLGWESGDVSEASPSELEPHSKNKEIYGDTESVDQLDDTFVESVREKGVLEPLVITEDKRIISGHRRWLAAKNTDREKVPVRVTEFDSEFAEREALVEFNRQREKTPGQIVNEFEEIVAIEQQRAKERQAEAGEQNLPTTQSESSSGKVSRTNETAREKAAEKLDSNITGRTLEKGLEVKEKAEEGNDTAQQEWEKLEQGDTSFHRAKKNVEKAEAEQEVEEQEHADRETTPLIKQSDAHDLLEHFADHSVDLLITDPPYSTDVDNIQEFAEGWLPNATEKIADDGSAYIFVGAYPQELESYLSIINTELDRFESQVLVWTYRNTIGQTPNDRYKLNWQAILYLRGPDANELDAPKTSEQWSVQDVNAPDARFGERHHKWQKPSEIVERFIRHSTNENDTVIDPFAGTGTHVLAAAELGRDVLGSDNDPEMLDIARERGCKIDE